MYTHHSPVCLPAGRQANAKWRMMGYATIFISAVSQNDLKAV
jgi:hypothetical protein